MRVVLVGYFGLTGSKGKWSFGDDESKLKDYGWYGDNSGKSGINVEKIWQTDKDNYYQRVMNNKCQTHRVGEKKPNKWGIYDMHGNVWEWCEDDWVNNYQKTPRDGTANILQKAEKNTYKVLRSGSWYDYSNNCRCAGRSYYGPSFVDNFNGFRVVCL